MSKGREVSAPEDPWNHSQLLFMRHGNEHYVSSGPLDPALYPDIDAYGYVADTFKDPQSWPDMILVSPMRRCIQTALWAFQHVLAAEKLIPVVQDARIEEIMCTAGDKESTMGTPLGMRDW